MKFFIVPREIDYANMPDNAITKLSLGPSPGSSGVATPIPRAIAEYISSKFSVRKKGP